MMELECISCTLTLPIEDFEWQNNRPTPRKKCSVCRHQERDYTKEREYRKMKQRERSKDGRTRKDWDMWMYGVCRTELGKQECRICENKNDLCIDHNHKTGEVRGLLCRTCNTGIGMLRNSPDLLRSAVAYLEKEE